MRVLIDAGTAPVASMQRAPLHETYKRQNEAGATAFSWLVRLFIPFTLILVIFIPTIPCAYAATAPLLERVEALHCATNENTARKALDNLWGISVDKYKFPNEWLDNNSHDDKQNKTSLYAGSMDITLNTLVKTAQKYPKLRRDVERTLLQWSYCDLYKDGQFYDLVLNKGKLHKFIAAYRSPLDWEGFRKTGFFPNMPAEFIPDLLLKSPLGERAFENFFHRIYRKQCFPHPVTGKMFHTKQLITPIPLVTRVPLPRHTIYPYHWDKECHAPNIVIPAVITLAETIVMSAPPRKREIKKEPPVEPEIKQEQKPVEKKTRLLTNKTPQIKQPSAEEPSPGPPVEVPQAAPDSDRVSAEPKPEIPAKKMDLVLKKTVETVPVVITQKGPKKHLEKTPTQSLPAPLTYPPASAAGAFPIPRVISKDPKKPKKFTVGFRLSRSLGTDATSLGGSLSFAPISDSYWSVRSGFNYNLKAKQDPFSYSWGFGYDDWHAETWSFQINHWGPIKPGNGLEWTKAVGNIGYKLKSDTLAKFNLSPSISVDVPIRGDAALNVGLQYSPKESWYIRAGINKGFNDNKPSWSYGFGYSNWRPEKINVEYSNYGPNQLFDTNYQKNGTISITYNIQF